MEIDIIDGQISLNGRAAPGSEGFEVRTKGIRKSESGLWVCTKCGAADSRVHLKQTSRMADLHLR